MTGRSPDDLRFLLLAGASLEISAKNLTELELRYLALTAAQNKLKPRVVLRDLDGFSTDVLRRVAMAGQGCVVYDDLQVEPSETAMAAPKHPMAN